LNFFDYLLKELQIGNVSPETTLFQSQRLALQPRKNWFNEKHKAVSCGVEPLKLVEKRD